MDQNLDEYDVLRKSIRKYRKKLRQVERLETCGRDLSEEERIKLSKRDFFRKTLQHFLSELQIFETSLPPQETSLLSEESDVSDADEQFDAVDHQHLDEEKFEISKTDFSCDQKEETNKGDADNEIKIEPMSKEVEEPVKNKIKKPKSRLRKAWKSKTFEVVELLGHNDIVCAVDIDRNWIISASRDTSVKLWDSTSNEEVCNLTGHTGPVTCVKLVSEPESNQLKQILKADRSEISCNLSHNSFEREQLVITASTDCSIRIWLLPSGGFIKSLYNYSSVTSLCYQNNILIVGTDSGKISIYNIRRGVLLFNQIICSERITSLQCSDSRLAATSDFGQLFVWDICNESTNECLKVDDELKDISLRKILSLVDTDLYIEGRQAFSCLFMPSNDGLLLFGDDAVNLKLIDIKTASFTKFPNQKPGSAGFTDSIVYTNNFVLSTSFDADNGEGSINVRSLEGETIFAYVATLTHHQIPRITCSSINKDQPLRFVTGGNKLLSWVELPEKQTKTKREDSENKFYVKGSYVAELTRSPVDSDAESSEDEDEEDAGTWFWSTKSKQAPNRDSKPEGCSESDSELMTSSSNDEDDVEKDAGSWKWCSIL